MSAPQASPTLNQIDIFNLIAGDLRTFLAPLGGVVSIARDPFEVSELLSEAPGKFRVILAWDGEDTVGDHRSGIVAHHFRFIVSHNRGLGILSGGNLSVNRGNDSPLMGLANQVRDRLRALYIPDIAGQSSTTGLLQYLGAELISVGAEGKAAVYLDAYSLKFRFIARITVLTQYAGPQPGPAGSVPTPP